MKTNIKKLFTGALEGVNLGKLSVKVPVLKYNLSSKIVYSFFNAITPKYRIFN